MNRPTITQARHVCDALKARGVIVLAFTSDNFAAASYGETKGECQQLRNTLDAIMDGIEDGEIPVWNGHPVTLDERAENAEKTIAALTAERDRLRAELDKNHTNIRNRGRVGACPTDSE